VNSSVGHYRIYADSDEDQCILKVYRVICDLVEVIEMITDEALSDNLSDISIIGFASIPVMKYVIGNILLPAPLLL